MTKTRKICLILLSGMLIICGIGMLFYFYYLNRTVCREFSGKRWELPARIYSRALELYPGRELKSDIFVRELRLMQYRQISQANSPGTFVRNRDTFDICSRAFVFEDGEEASKSFRAVLRNGKVLSLRNLETGQPAELIRLDPAHIGSFYPSHHEDRILIKLENIRKQQKLLPETLLAVEDRYFYKHHGINFLAILRAMITNIREWRTVQGGSTLTQQLVKNFFLTQERTFRRKFDEALMSLALEWNYEKDEILEAYLNEVYMGQDGRRAIHGFGLGSMFYFGRPIHELGIHEIALLVGMLKGPSYFDPRHHPERALKRRNTVLQIMVEQKLISGDIARKNMQFPLGVIKDYQRGITKFPAFLDLVRRQLLREYKEKDLRSEGLRIFTSLDPQIQFAAENAMISRIKAIETRHYLPKGKLEVSAIITSSSGNEVLAIIGGRNPRFHGFNRALNAKRPIGSLIKPAIFLTALQYPEYYSLITPLADTFLQLTDENTGKNWTPQNYDLQYHGIIPLYLSLVHSYNVASVRLGLDLGLDDVFRTIQRMGFKREITIYPSSLLGTMGMSVFEVAQMYQTLASGGFYSPIRSICTVLTAEGKPLQRYPLSVQQSFEPGHVYLVNKMLQLVVSEGTAASLKYILPRSPGLAGKTGTTNDLRDSWFAGFSGDKLAVVWMGRDDNQTCGLTGASGALQVWGNIMVNIPHTPLILPQPETVEWAAIDVETGLRPRDDFENTVAIPFIKGFSPKQNFVDMGRQPVSAEERGRTSEAPAKDTPKSQKTLMEWLRGLF